MYFRACSVLYAVHSICYEIFQSFKQNDLALFNIGIGSSFAENVHDQKLLNTYHGTQRTYFGISCKNLPTKSHFFN